MNWKLYVVTHPDSCKYYIGVTSKKNVKHRLAEHKQNKRKTIFTCWLKKYQDCIIKEVYKDLTKKEAQSLESIIVSEKTLKNNPNLLNMCPGGIIPPSRNYWTEKQRKKHLKKTREIGRRPKTAETKKKISEAQLGEKNHMFGKTASPETKEKMSQAHSGKNNHFFGRKHSKETRRKMSEKAKNRPPRSKQHILALKKSMEKYKKYYKLVSPYGIVYEGKGIAEFCRQHNLKDCRISEILNGKKRNYKGWTKYREP